MLVTAVPLRQPVSLMIAVPGLSKARHGDAGSREAARCGKSLSVWFEMIAPRPCFIVRTLVLTGLARRRVSTLPSACFQV